MGEDLILHRSVMVKEVLYWLDPREGGVYVDCTLGAGGHSKAILDKLQGRVKLLGIDRDEEALRVAEEELDQYKEQVLLVKGNFGDLPQILKERKLKKVDGLLYDLGVSSLQLDAPERGFSFRYSGLLDMRMDRGQVLTAGHLVNQLPVRELEDIFFRLGEERWARRIAKFIIEERRKHPLETTRDLVEVIRKAIPAAARRRKIHFATKSFQALRIKVNEELENLRVSLDNCPHFLLPGGRICVISYHSLEDRLVKEAFKGEEVDILTRKVVRPSWEEIKANPRARSAKLRAVKKR